MNETSSAAVATAHNDDDDNDADVASMATGHHDATHVANRQRSTCCRLPATCNSHVHNTRSKLRSVVYGS